MMSRSIFCGVYWPLSLYVEQGEQIPSPRPTGPPQITHHTAADTAPYAGLYFETKSS